MLPLPPTPPQTPLPSPASLSSRCRPPPQRQLPIETRPHTLYHGEAAGWGPKVKPGHCETMRPPVRRVPLYLKPNIRALQLNRIRPRGLTRMALCVTSVRCNTQGATVGIEEDIKRVAVTPEVSPAVCPARFGRFHPPVSPGVCSCPLSPLSRSPARNTSVINSSVDEGVDGGIFER